MNYVLTNRAQIPTLISHVPENEAYPGTPQEVKEEQYGLHTHMNPMTAMKNDYFSEQQREYGASNPSMPRVEQKDEDLMLGNMPVFNQHYCDQMTDKLRHLNMSKNGQRKSSYRFNATRLERHPFNVIHPLKVINCSKDSAGSLSLSKQGSGASTGSNSMVNPLNMALEDRSRNIAALDPVDQILNIDDLLIKNDDEHEKCDSARNLQSVIDTRSLDEASRSASFSFGHLKRQFPSIAQSSAADPKFGLEFGPLNELKPQHSLVTEATSNSVCSTELEYKDTATTCKSFLMSNNLPVLPEQDEEQIEAPHPQTGRTYSRLGHLKSRESKLRQKIETIRATIKATQTSQCGRRLQKLNQLRI